MSSHKKRRELNRATAEHTHARIRAELAQGIVNFENLMEHAMGVRIKELERERDALQADNAELVAALKPFGAIDLVESRLPAEFAMLILRARAAIATVRKL